MIAQSFIALFWKKNEFFYSPFYFYYEFLSISSLKLICIAEMISSLSLLLVIILLVYLLVPLVLLLRLFEKTKSYLKSSFLSLLDDNLWQVLSGGGSFEIVGLLVAFLVWLRFSSLSEYCSSQVLLVELDQCNVGPMCTAGF